MLGARMRPTERLLATPRLVWGVAALVQAVGDALAARFAACTVRGELSGFNRASSGHCYFSLKDADGAAALLRCAMFRRAGAMLGFAPVDGQLVELRGRLALYEPRGELQFVVEAMQPAGAGALYEQFLRLRSRLEAEGLFEPIRKRALPPHARAVGVVTSLGAAALHDVLSALSRRAPHVPVTIYPSLVQGPDAPAALVQAMALANRRAEVDVLIVCRGGGSLEDLWAFNDERVVRAIVGSALPVVSAVGHETDVTLADLAADLRAPTPSIGAELVAPLHAKLLEQLAALTLRLSRGALHRMETLQQRLDRAEARLARPSQRLARERLALALLARRLPQAVHQAVLQRHDALHRAGRALRHGADLACTRARHREQQLAARLTGLDPRRVTARGYALVHTRRGELVMAPGQIVEGEALRLTLARGLAELCATAVRRHDG
jgi:exodeoxyribonuclease VII large subunit